jgi:hypothetical protein
MAEHYKAILTSLIGEIYHGGDLKSTAERAKRIRDERAAIKRDYKGKEQKKLLSEIPTPSPEELYLITMYSDLAILTDVLNSKTYAEMRDAISQKFDDIERISSSDKTEAMIAFQTARTSIKDDVTGYAKRYFSFTEEDWREHISDLARLIKVAAVFIEKFDTVYFCEKKKRAMLEYSDIERLTYESLYNSDGTLSDLAKNSAIDPQTSFAIGAVAIRKTVGALPSVHEDLTEDEIAAINAIEFMQTDWYYGTYDGYAIFGVEGLFGEGIRLSFASADSVGMKLKFVDQAHAYKDGEMLNLGDLYDKINLSNDDVMLINFIDCVLYSDYIVNGK